MILLDDDYAETLVPTVWLLLAALFLAEVWLWDRLTEVGRWLRDRLPFRGISGRGGVAARVCLLPPLGARASLSVIPVIYRHRRSSS